MTIAAIAKAAAIKAINEDQLNLAKSCLAVAVSGGEDSWWLTDSAEAAAADLEVWTSYDAELHKEKGFRAAVADMIAKYLAR